jgi:outer membrane protein TolC
MTATNRPVLTAVDVFRVDFENARTRVAEARRQLAEAENDYAAAKADLAQALHEGD